MNEQEDFNLKGLSAQLNTLIRLNAITLAEGRKRRDQIRLLSAAGLPPKTIAELIGTTPNTVSVELSSLRREEGAIGAKSKKPNDQDN